MDNHVLNVLGEMFPDLPRSTATDVLHQLNWDLSKAVDYLTGSQQVTPPGHKGLFLTTVPDTSLHIILSYLTTKDLASISAVNLPCQLYD